MTVSVTKPAVNLREELADLRKPTGIAGEAMLRAETPQEQFNLIGAGRRNWIINGAMQVAQRGTSFSNPNAVYTLDRFMARTGTSGALTVSQQSMDYGQTDVPHIQNFVRLAQTTARTGAFSFFWQRVEDVTRFDNTTVTISFYAKCSVDKQIKLSTYQDFGTSGSSDVVVDNTEFNIETSWKRFEVTMHCPSINGKTVNAGSHLLVEFRDETLGAFTLDITGIQLEYGKVATPFEHRSYGEELALCQRYYQKLGHGTHELPIGFGYLYNEGVKSSFSIPLSASMRSTPSLEGTGDAILVKSGGTQVALAPSHFTVSYLKNSSQVGLYSNANTHADMGSSQDSAMLTNTSTDETICLDAEL